MGKRRAIDAFVAVALLIALLGASGCSSKSSAKTQARAATQAKAARAKVAAAKRRLAAARVRVAAQRRALAVVIRRQRLKAQAEAKAAAKRATSTTTAPKVATPTTAPKPSAPPPTVPRPPPAPATSAAGDVAAIQRAIDTVNAAFAKGVAAGIAASEFANYYVSAGVYSDGQCSAFEAARGLGVVADRLVVHADSVVPTPGFVDPILHAVPKGRVYGLTMDDVQTQIVTKQTRTQRITTHATVGANGRAQLFFRCH